MAFFFRITMITKGSKQEIRIGPFKLGRFDSDQQKNSGESRSNEHAHKPNYLPLIDEAFSSSPAEHSDHHGTFTFQTHNLGNVFLRSGGLVAADAITTPDSPPFDTQLPPGRYPVSVAVKEFLTSKKPTCGGGKSDGDIRVAYAKLTIAEKPVKQWLMATTTDQDLRKLKNDEYYGYPVDAGVGSFMDLQASKILWNDHTEKLSNQILSELNKHQLNTWSWANIIVDPYSELNVIIFSSGYGDGAYPTYFGLTESGEIACVVSDFMIIETDNAY